MSLTREELFPGLVVLNSRTGEKGTIRSKRGKIAEVAISKGDIAVFVDTAKGKKEWAFTSLMIPVTESAETVIVETNPTTPA